MQQRLHHRKLRHLHRGFDVAISQDDKPVSNKQLMTPKINFPAAQYVQIWYEDCIIHATDVDNDDGEDASSIIHDNDNVGALYIDHVKDAHLNIVEDVGTIDIGIGDLDVPHHDDNFDVVHNHHEITHLLSCTSNADDGSIGSDSTDDDAIDDDDSNGDKATNDDDIVDDDSINEYLPPLIPMPDEHAVVGKDYLEAPLDPTTRGDQLPTLGRSRR